MFGEAKQDKRSEPFCDRSERDPAHEAREEHRVLRRNGHNVRRLHRLYSTLNKPKSQVWEHVLEMGGWEGALDV